MQSVAEECLDKSCVGCECTVNVRADMTQEIMDGYRKEFFEVLDTAYEHMDELRASHERGEDVSIDEWIMLNLYLDVSVIRIEKMIKKLQASSDK